MLVLHKKDGPTNMRTRADILTLISLPDGVVKVDEAGYLTDPNAWSRDFARYIANAEGIALNDLHWEILGEMRGYFDRHAIAMDQRFILKFLGRKFNTDKTGAKQKLFDHFPYGYIKQAVKMAGMRQPRGWSTG